MRRTKILATLDPASADPEILERMIAVGLDAVISEGLFTATVRPQ